MARDSWNPKSVNCSALPALPRLPAARRDIVVFRDSLLGAGATGLVYKGMYQGRTVAIKVIECAQQ